MTENPRPFVIPLRRRWGLVILPVLCLLYFAGVMVLVVLNMRIDGVSNELLALGGAALFGLTLLIELPFFLRRRRPRAEPEETMGAVDEGTAFQGGFQDEPAEPRARVRAPVDDEAVLTTESQQGLRVIEYSRPAKSRHKGSVYAKTYVPVTKEHVLRVETLAAEPRDL